MSKTKRIAFVGVLAAVYFALSYLVVDTGSLKFTFTSLAILVTALLFTPLEACAVALVGEFFYQVVIFGVTATTPIWLLPPVIHGLSLGLCAWLFRRKGKPLENRPVLCVALCMGCAVLNTVCNTTALYADSKIFGYYEYHMVFGVALIRAGVGLATALAVSLVAIPLVRGIRKHGF